MKHVLFLVTFLALSSYLVRGDEEAKDDSGFIPEFPKSISDSKTYKKFIKIVEEQKLNVTVLISTTEKWKNGNTKNLISLSATFPENDIVAKDSPANKEAARKFLKLATSEKLTAAGAIYTPGKEPVVLTNNVQGRILPYNYKIYTNLTSGVLGINPLTEENLSAQETFFIEGPNNQKETVKVLWGKLSVNTTKSKGVEENDLRTIEEILAEALYEYDTTDIPRVLVAKVDKLLPEAAWQASYGAEEDSFLDAKKYAFLEILGNKYVVFGS